MQLLPPFLPHWLSFSPILLPPSVSFPLPLFEIYHDVCVSPSQEGPAFRESLFVSFLSSCSQTVNVVQDGISSVSKFRKTHRPAKCFRKGVSEGLSILLKVSSFLVDVTTDTIFGNRSIFQSKSFRLRWYRMLVQNRYVSAKPTKIELTITSYCQLDLGLGITIELTITSYCNSIFRLSLKIEFIPAGYVRRIFRLSLKLKKSSMNTIDYINLLGWAYSFIRDPKMALKY